MGKKKLKKQLKEARRAYDAIIEIKKICASHGTNCTKCPFWDKEESLCVFDQMNEATPVLWVAPLYEKPKKSLIKDL